jgi:hypothetical protein
MLLKESYEAHEYKIQTWKLLKWVVHVIAAQL